MKMRPLFATTALLLLAVAPAAQGVGTRTFELNSLDELSGGDLKGTMVDSLGHVRAGFDLGALPLGDATSIWSALVQADGSVLVGTGNTGKILRVNNAQVAPFAETGQLAVTSLVTAFGKGVYGGTIPNGRVVKIEGNKATKFVDLEGADHVWALAYDEKQNALFAATGPNGKLFRIDAAGKAQVYFDSDEPHLVSLAIGDNGALYAGSSGKAILYRITGPGRATVLYDLPGEDVKAIALGPKGKVFAISNEYAELPEIPKRSSSGVAQAAPTSAARPKPGKGTLTAIDADGRPDRLLKRDDTHFTALGVGLDGQPYVGTGVEGRVYTVDEAHTSTLVADTDERQVTFLLLAGKRRFVATSDPAVLHEVRGTGGPDAVWTSKVLDATNRSQFGRLLWRATGPLEMSTRTGNTQVPDKTWSDWSAPLPAPGKVTSPAARFVQVRARFAKDPNAVLSEIIIPYVSDNLRAIITSVDAQTKAASRDGLAATDPDRHSSVVKVTWHTDNPDGDALRYRLSYRLEGQNVYRDLTRPDEPITKAEFEWETASLPEGWYRVRVEATDEAVNPPDRVFRHSLESPVVLVDNTPPVFRTLAAQGRRIRGDAVDGLGPMTRIDVAVDGKNDWHPYLPVDGIFDEPAEAFDLDVSSFVGAGNHLVAVRIFDQAGNFVVRDVEVK
jgi:hypothetical protein